MKIKNLSNSRIYLNDLKNLSGSQADSNRGEDFYLNPGQSIYVPDTSEVLRSVHKGSIHRLIQSNKIAIRDTYVVSMNETAEIDHNLGYPVTTVVFKQVDNNWVDATGIVDVEHNHDFTQTNITNVIDETITLLVKIT